MILHRSLAPIAFSKEFGRQMRLIVGPRQAGKTVFAREFLKSEKCENFYYNWDTDRVKSRYKEDPYFYWGDSENSARDKKTHPWICFDEIHKRRKWKDVLKDAFDSFEESLRFVVTGSAKLDVFRKAGDSLAGRYLLFNLNPLSFAESVRNACSLLPAENEGARVWIERQLAQPSVPLEGLSSLLEYGPFPEPFVRQSKIFHRRWGQNYLDRLIREDLREWTAMMDFQQLSSLSDLLPGRVGSPLSVRSLLSDLQVSHPTVKRYLQILSDFFFCFSVGPYKARIARALTQERKYYCFDYTRVSEPGFRFENFVALELKIICDLWTDAGGGPWKLHYVRTRDGRETNFLLTHRETPWLLVEAKVSDKSMGTHHFHHSTLLGGIPVLQICRTGNLLRRVDKNGIIVSASRFF